MELVAHTLPQAMHLQQHINLTWDTQQIDSLIIVHALVQALALVQWNHQSYRNPTLKEV
jgi:hypothetical protein